MPTNANGKANTECSTLIISRYVRVADTLICSRLSPLGKNWNVSENLEPIRFPKHLQQAIDHDEYGHPRQNIAAIMDSHGWDLKHFDNFEPRISEFEKACGESIAWIEQASRRDEHYLLGAAKEFDRELLARAA